MTKWGFLLVFAAACGTNEPPATKPAASQATTSQPTASAVQPQPIAVPEYEIFEDSIDSDGMRIVFVAATDGFSAVQQRAIVADIVKAEVGKDRWTRAFVRARSNRNQVQRNDCLEAFNGGAIHGCDYRR